MHLIYHFAQSEVEVMKIKKWLIAILSIVSIFTCNLALAGFRNALDAYTAKDSVAMLAAVQDAVETKNDDGIILYLSVLKQSPEILHEFLSPKQQKRLFSNLEAAANRSGLQAQYKLAIIPRISYQKYPKPKVKEAAIKDRKEEIRRLMPIADKNYPPALIRLYGYLSRPIEKNQKPDYKFALNLLRRAADANDFTGLFLLAIKYLQINELEDVCRHSIPDKECYLPKSEEKGWDLMQRAAEHASKRNFLFRDFAYVMGKLYSQGVASQQPDLKQSYLWLREGFNSFSGQISQSRVLSLLNEVRHKSSLNLAYPWELRKEELPALMPENEIVSDSTQPMFSLISFSFNKTNLALDVYADGKVNLFLSDSYESHHTNNELWKQVSPKDISKFKKKLLALDFLKSYQKAYDPGWGCSYGCRNALRIIVSVNTAEKKQWSRFAANSFDAYQKSSNHNLFSILVLLEDYMSISDFTCSLFNLNTNKECAEINTEIFNQQR